MREDPGFGVETAISDGRPRWHLSRRGHDVGIVDKLSRPPLLTTSEMGVDKPCPDTKPANGRVRTWEEVSAWSRDDDLRRRPTDAPFVDGVLRDFQPDTVVHFAEQRSAPYSMIDQKHAVYTQVNNVVGTLNLLYAIADVDPSIHLVKRRNDGPSTAPPTSTSKRAHRDHPPWADRRAALPQQPGSFYHLSKVHDSANIMFACRIWGLGLDDLNQGIVYGQRPRRPPCTRTLATRLYD